jgi:hypothetical protein
MAVGPSFLLPQTIRDLFDAFLAIVHCRLQVVAGRARPAAYILRRTGTSIRPTIG